MAAALAGSLVAVGRVDSDAIIDSPSRVIRAERTASRTWLGGQSRVKIARRNWLQVVDVIECEVHGSGWIHRIGERRSSTVCLRYWDLSPSWMVLLLLGKPFCLCVEWEKNAERSETREQMTTMIPTQGSRPLWNRLPHPSIHPCALAMSYGIAHIIVQCW